MQLQNPYTATLCEMGEISNLCQFGWYEWNYFQEAKPKILFQMEVLGHCLGPTRNDGNDMCQAILHMNEKNDTTSVTLPPPYQSIGNI